MIYIFDLDGTVADLSHRLRFIKQAPKDWAAFYAACSDDEVIEEVAYFARLLHDCGHKVFFVTGRSDVCEERTQDWLRNNFIPFTSVYMRAEGDHRPDTIVKAELVDDLMTDWREYGKPAGIFEDRQQVVDMYRAKGLRVFQVSVGNF